MALSSQLLAQWRHAGHNRRACGARWRGDPRRLRGVRRHRRQLRSRLARGRAPVVLGDRPGRIPAPAGEPGGLVAGRRRRRVRLRRGARGRVPADGREPLGGDLLDHRGDRAAGALARRGRPAAGVGLFGLFPTGRPERVYERVVIWTVALAGFLLPLLEAVSRPTSRRPGPPDSVPPVLYRALYVPALAPLGGAAEAVYRTFPVWPLIGVAFSRCVTGAPTGPSAGRYAGCSLAWRSHSACGSRRPCSGSWPTRTTRPPRPRAKCWPTWGSPPPWGRLLVALFYTGVFGIDQPARRTFVHRVLRVSIAVVLALLAILAGCWPAGSRRPPSPWRSRWPPGLRARPSGAVWSTPRTAGCSARGWPATPTSAGSDGA